MEQIYINTQAGKRLETVYNINDFPYSFTNYDFEIVRKARKGSYYNIDAAFDIEATTIQGKEKPVAFMYHWQFCLHDNVCFGRTWDDFKTFIERLRKGFQLSDGVRLVVYVHNLAYEFQFFRNFFEIQNIFATDPRKVISAQISGIEFRCSYKLSNMSLEKFCSSSKGCIYWKKDGGAFNYEKLRTPSTPLTELEKEYCYCDVRGLCECIRALMADDTLATIPLTSTGYVRREARRAVKENPANHEKLKTLCIDKHKYILLRTARRGGNTHALALYSNEVIEGVKSKDKKSSYPASMLLYDYPMSPFLQIKGQKEFYKRLDAGNMAMLIDVSFINLSIKNMRTIPYIARAKCTQLECRGALFDNGRVIRASACRMVCTDVDFRIIVEQYLAEDIEINECYIAEYAPLPKEFRECVRSMFIEKEKLKDGDPYLYAKFKNKINALFGMMLTDICHPRIEYNPDGQTEDIDGEGGLFECEVGDIAEELRQYYKSRNSFLAYQWGVWVTAHSRAALQDGLNAVERDGLYTDTDSVKYIGDHDADFERLNRSIIELANKRDVPAYIDTPKGRVYLGTWENDGEYSRFKTCGAKKYAYEDAEGLHITVAGLNKNSGAEYIKQKGGIDAFNIGTVFPEKWAKRTVSYFNDEKAPYILTVTNERGEREKILTGSNIAIVPTTYTLGITEEYADLIDYARAFRD